MHRIVGSRTADAWGRGSTRLDGGRPGSRRPDGAPAGSRRFARWRLPDGPGVTASARHVVLGPIVAARYGATAAARHVLLAARHGAAVAATLAFALSTPAAAGPPALDPPTADAIAEARAIVERMKKADRGPYSRLRWFCDDGSVHPPQPYPCSDRGGGHQHAEYSNDRRRLAELGWSVGTILTALEWDELWDAENRHQRLRELALERYLIDVDDGWVMRRARYYRGYVQIEDELDAGFRHLVAMLSRPNWVRDNFLLARESVRTIPHHGGSDMTRAIRRLSKDIATQNPSFETIRIKIHTNPQAKDADDVDEWLEHNATTGSAADSATTEKAHELAAEIRQLYGEGGRAERFAEALDAIEDGDIVAELSDWMDGVFTSSASDRVASLAAVMLRIRDTVSTSTDGERNLALLDLSIDVEAELVASAHEALQRDAQRRADLLRLMQYVLEATYGSGLLSAGELSEARQFPRAAQDQSRIDSIEYLNGVRAMHRASIWALAAVHYTFAEPLTRYAALEPLAAQFPDDLLRGSACLPAAQILALLRRDAEFHAGVTHVVLDQESEGLAGLNPGAAVGRLRIVRESDLVDDSGFDTGEIVVLPRTVSTLTPVAGIVTLAEGNILSHVQLLARNLGIPNAALDPSFANVLSPYDGRDMLLAVGSNGSIVLQPLDRVPGSVRNLLQTELDAGHAPAHKVEAPVPDLRIRRPIPLTGLHAGLSGRVVGPKAANLGELARVFPEHVSPAIALPFGVFAAHAADGSGSPKARLDRTFQQYRAGWLDHEELEMGVDILRRSIESMDIDFEIQAQLMTLMSEYFGEPGSYGVFVRSDTNVEDLPEFTGAGLNKTIANVVGFEAQMTAIAEVWASPFTRRALAWRERVLRRPEEVYPSILLMKSVDVEKSGVLVTRDLITGGRGLTVATGWGVTGVVEGESAETLVLREDGAYTLVSEAKAPYARRLRPAGGMEWVPAAAGRVLTEPERRALRELAEQALERLKPVFGADGRQLPWDIEFGFKDEMLYLFQVRPLVERGESLADQVVAALAPVGETKPQVLHLNEPIELAPTQEQDP